MKILKEGGPEGLASYLAEHPHSSRRIQDEMMQVKLFPSGPPAEVISGRPTIHLVWEVPKEKEAEVDAYWQRHEAWMRETHSVGLDGAPPR